MGRGQRSTNDRFVRSGRIGQYLFLTATSLVSLNFSVNSRKYLRRRRIDTSAFFKLSQTETVKFHLFSLHLIDWWHSCQKWDCFHGLCSNLPTRQSWGFIRGHRNLHHALPERLSLAVFPLSRRCCSSVDDAVLGPHLKDNHRRTPPPTLRRLRRLRRVWRLCTSATWTGMTAGVGIRTRACAQDAYWSTRTDAETNPCDARARGPGGERTATPRDREPAGRAHANCDCSREEETFGKIRRLRQQW